MTNSSESSSQALQMAVDVVTAQLVNNQIPTNEVSGFLREIFATIRELEGSASGPVEAPVPAVPVDQSVFHDYIVCLEDGKKLRMLKRYLMAQFGMTPADYKAKWGLPQDYPMAAPALSAQRQNTAKALGLGRRSEKPARGKKAK
jgi:predicted transcriptional regulator